MRGLLAELANPLANPLGKARFRGPGGVSLGRDSGR
jgi:hypothetical protein